MAAVVTALGPAAQDEQAPLDAQIPAQVLGDGRRFGECPTDFDRLLLGALVVHASGQASPELEIRRSHESFGVRIATDLVPQRRRQSFPFGDAAIAGRHRFQSLCPAEPNRTARAERRSVRAVVSRRFTGSSDAVRCISAQT